MTGLIQTLDVHASRLESLTALRAQHERLEEKVDEVDSQWRMATDEWQQALDAQGRDLREAVGTQESNFRSFAMSMQDECRRHHAETAMAMEQHALRLLPFPPGLTPPP